MQNIDNRSFTSSTSTTIHCHSHFLQTRDVQKMSIERVFNSQHVHTTRDHTTGTFETTLLRTVIIPEPIGRKKL